MITEPEGTDEELRALVTDAIKVGDVARRYARLYGGDANTVHAAVEATLDVLLQRKAVEGSTPLDSPTSARCAHCTAAIGVNEMFSVMDGCRHRLCSRCLDQDHDCAAAPTGEVAPDMRSRRQGGRGPVAGEVASGDVVEAIMDTIDCYPGPVAGVPTRAHIEKLIRDYAAGQRAEGVEEGRRRAGEPVPVPPPVDALLKLVDEYSDEIEYGTAAESACDSHTSALYGVAAKETRDSINRAINALWATGVEEGRREQAGKVEELQVLLDHAEQYARDLQDNGDVAERDEEWGLRYKLNGTQQEAGDGGHVFSSREEAEQHITAWRKHYPGLTYTDVEYLRRETSTGPWEVDHG